MGRTYNVTAEVSCKEILRHRADLKSNVHSRLLISAGLSQSREDAKKTQTNAAFFFAYPLRLCGNLLFDKLNISLSRKAAKKTQRRMYVASPLASFSQSLIP